MAKGSRTRLANGVVSAAVAVFFLVHGVLGSLALVWGFSSPLAWLVWVGVGLIGVHVALSVATSREQLGDVERPPSARKKRHLALKWATGGVLAALAVAHIVVGRAPALTVALSAALAVHVWVGAKSLLTDLGIDRHHMTALRIVVCVLAALFAIAALYSPTN